MKTPKSFAKTSKEIAKGSQHHLSALAIGLSAVLSSVISTQGNWIIT